MRRIIAAFVCLGLLGLTSPAQARERLTQWVDPFIGTDGTGNTFPGASVPFGMVAPSPDNEGGRTRLASGYRYSAPKILGFSNTHISGAGIPELGDILIQPTAGTPWIGQTAEFAAPYDKASEKAHPGWYSVRLPDHQVRIELTASAKVAVQRYRFDRPGKVQVLVDLQHGLQFLDQDRVKASEVQLDKATGEITGTITASNWVDRQTAFIVRFDHAIERVETLPKAVATDAPRYILTFDLGGGQSLEARIALSTVDVAGARGNLATGEGLTFDQIRNQADQAWETLLGRIEITAPLRQKRLFYTALYHALLHPSEIADHDGRVRGPTGQVIQAKDGVYYSTLSLWDTYRAQFPLLALVAPGRVNGLINTMLDHAKAQGVLPVWTVWGRETWCMTGNPALPVIAAAVAYGFKGFDQEAALKAMVESSTQTPSAAPAWRQIDWGLYQALGYLPFDKVTNESISVTLELGVSDDAVARLAARLGQSDLATQFAKRAQGWRKVFDPQTRLVRGKDSAGSWRSPFDPITPTSPLQNPGDYTEGNAWQYTLTPALHDAAGLAQAMGGPKGFGDWLDTYFTQGGLQENKDLGQEALIGQYAHGNEPNHHAAYLYAWTDRPWIGVARIRQIYQQFYSATPDGLKGNDDAGQMSAWYVLTTLGLYPVAPASGQFVAGSPQVTLARLHNAKGHSLTIRRSGDTSPKAYAAKIVLNARPQNRTAIAFGDLVAGGDLTFQMTAPPSPSVSP